MTKTKYQKWVDVNREHYNEYHRKYNNECRAKNREKYNAHQREYLKKWRKAQ